MTVHDYDLRKQQGLNNQTETAQTVIKTSCTVNCKNHGSMIEKASKPLWPDLKFECTYKILLFTYSFVWLVELSFSLALNLLNLKCIRSTVNM